MFSETSSTAPLPCRYFWQLLSFKRMGHPKSALQIHNCKLGGGGGRDHKYCQLGAAWSWISMAVNCSWISSSERQENWKAGYYGVLSPSWVQYTIISRCYQHARQCGCVVRLSYLDGEKPGLNFLSATKLSAMKAVWFSGDSIDLGMEKPSFELVLIYEDRMVQNG